MPVEGLPPVDGSLTKTKLTSSSDYRIHFKM